MATIRKRFGKWQIQIRRQHYPLITKTFLSKKTAEQWDRKIGNEIDKGILNLCKKESTLRALVDRYISEISSKKRGYFNEKITLEAFKREKFVNFSVLKITAEHFAQYRDKRLQKVKPATIVRELCIIKHLYNIANKEWGFAVKNPILNIRKPTISNKRERRLTNEEYNFLVKGNYSHKYLRSIIELAIETGMRRGEILRIDYNDIGSQILTINQTKNGHPRTIPLTKKALYILKNTQLPFPMSANAVRLAWDGLKKKGNIKDLHFHDLRHEAISRFFEKGLSIPEVALISGHRDYKMLFRYTHLKAEDILRKL